MSEKDTVVQCKKCGKKQHLDFVDGLKNGWPKCCGYTMTIIESTANVGQVVRANFAVERGDKP